MTTTRCNSGKPPLPRLRYSFFSGCASIAASSGVQYTSLFPPPIPFQTNTVKGLKVLFRMQAVVQGRLRCLCAKAAWEKWTSTLWVGQWQSLTPFRSNLLSVLGNKGLFCYSLLSTCQTASLALPHWASLLLGSKGLQILDPFSWQELGLMHTPQNVYGGEQLCLGANSFNSQKKNVPLEKHSKKWQFLITRLLNKYLFILEERKKRLLDQAQACLSSFSLKHFFND